jgi:hypothetical protein
MPQSDKYYVNNVLVEDLVSLSHAYQRLRGSFRQATTWCNCWTNTMIALARRLPSHGAVEEIATWIALEHAL